MTREEWLKGLAWCPKGVKETRRTERLPEQEPSEPPETSPHKAARR
jgi:hypothetical protein